VNTVTCPRCGQENPAGFRLCGMCGTPLAAAPAPAREERKRVSVLFCDLVGFTGRAERMDPEEVRALLQPYHARVRQELERHGGTVEKFIGDAVVALFGAPVAHEDDPERAVRAAIAIREAVAGDELQVRIGVTTGEALVARDARPESGEGMAFGDVVNTAARLQSAAPTNGILVDATTHRATELAIEYRPHQSIEAKGKSEPVPVWGAVAPHAPIGVERLGGAPLVGRERELELLTGAFERSRSERVVRLVTLVGVPGIGKTRLVRELGEALDRQRHLVTWRHGRSLPYGAGSSFTALAEIVKGEAGILDSDDGDTAAAKLVATAAQVAADASEAAWLELQLRPVVGLLADAEPGAGDRSEAFAAWGRFLEGMAERGPAVLVFEDLHWADEGLLDFVDHLVDRATGVPLLVVCTARPELLSRRPEWEGENPNSVTVSLPALSDEDTARLVRALVAGSGAPAAVESRAIARAGGNPLYAEEFARMVVDRSLPFDGDDALPESIQGIVAARLDGLAAEQKHVLQDAAVLGKVFSVAALERLDPLDRPRLEHTLHELERREFIRRERRTSVAGESEYAFSHAVVRDVAYGEIPRARRGEKHRLAAEWLETLAPDRLEDQADLLAHHYRRALELGRATGVVVEGLETRARRALRDAGDRAVRLNALGSAVGFYASALDLWPDDDERGRLLLEYGKALSAVELGGQEALTEARDRLLASGDAEDAAEAEAALGELLWHTRRGEDALDHLAAAVELVRDRPPTPAKAYALTSLARLKAFANAEAEAVVLAREALEVATDLGLGVSVARALDCLGTARIALGDLHGLVDLERSIELALAANAAVEAGRAYNNLAGFVYEAGETGRAHALYEEGLALAERFGIAHMAAVFRTRLARVAYDQGRWDDALRLLDEAGVPSQSPWIQTLIAIGRAGVEELLAVAAPGVDWTLRSGRPEFVALALSLRAYALVKLGRTTEAHAAARDLVAVAPTVNTTFPIGWHLVAVVLDALGRSREAIGLLDRARPTPWIEAARLYAGGNFEGAAARYAELGSRPREAESRLRAARTLLGEGRTTEARSQLEQAIDFYASVRATFHLAEAEELLRDAA
jgi:class 3 adenylate cyclase/tetratricopeptide (TPR) repeat protein